MFGNQPKNQSPKPFLGFGANNVERSDTQGVMDASADSSRFSSGCAGFAGVGRLRLLACKRDPLGGRSSGDASSIKIA
jgi:hypothetical protein